MSNNDVVLEGQKLIGPINLMGWRSLYVNPAHGVGGAIDLYFTVDPDYLIRLEDLKRSMSSDGIPASFLSRQSEEFSAFSNTPPIREILQKGDAKVREGIAGHGANRIWQATLAAAALFNPNLAEWHGEFRKAARGLFADAKDEFSYLDELTGPVADRAVLKASVSRERLDGFLNKHFSLPETTSEVLKALESARATFGGAPQPSTLIPA